MKIEEKKQYQFASDAKNHAFMRLLKVSKFSELGIYVILLK